MAPFLGLRGTKLLSFITFTMGLGWVCFGYDNSLLGGLLAAPWFVDQFHLDANDQGTVIGIFELGCFFGALGISVFGNVLGRRRALFIGGPLICIGALLQATTFHVAQLYVGRFIAGFGVGAITATMPALQAETSPPAIRGRLISCSLSMVLVGQLIGIWIDYGMLQHVGSVVFRFPCAFQAVFGGWMTLLVVWTPESPRWLVLKGRKEDARVVISALRDLPLDAKEVDDGLQDIVQAVELERSLRAEWKDFLRWKDDAVGSRRRVLLAIGIQSMQPFTGSTVVSYYTTTIFHDSVGLTLNTSTQMSGYLAIWFLLASFGTWYIIEKFGRRNMLMAMSLCMTTILFICGGLVKIGTHGSGIGAAVCVFLFQSFFTWGWMAGVWCYSAEIIPLAWRSKGLGTAVAGQWIFNFMWLKVTPLAVASLGYGFFFLFAAASACFVPVIYFLYPETSGLSLELLDLAFMGQVESNPVKESARLRKLLRTSRDGETAAAHELVMETAKPTIEHKEDFF